MQVQIQALLVGGAVAREVGVAAVEATEVARLQAFDSTPLKVSRFLSVYKLYIKIQLREALVKEQIQWILFYIQEKSVDIQKKNVIKNLEAEEVEYKLVEEFLLEIKKEFRREDEESVKIMKLKRIEQKGKNIKEFVQDFKRVVRGSGYEGCPLIKEFK